ncbi:NAD(P)H-dependent oxidoreductase [Pseudarthrobacter oxydans]|uniref:NAD(P)H-dependent oxidoreductase n=1 Tax=Pseudarthrobacter oxydans TaxID=1671 RepID=UPI0038006D9E
MTALVVMSMPILAHSSSTLPEPLRKQYEPQALRSKSPSSWPRASIPGSHIDLDLYRGKECDLDDVIAEQKRIGRADHLILVFPIYWWSMPALLKGWIDRVFVSGWAYEYSEEGDLVKKLDRLTVHLIPVAGDREESIRRHGVREAFRTQIERGIIEYFRSHARIVELSVRVRHKGSLCTRSGAPCGQRKRRGPGSK